VTRDSLYSAIVEIQPGNGSGEERRRIPSTVHTFADDWLTLIAAERLAPATAVGVENNDVLFVGEVVRSISWGSNEWAIDIKVAHTLTGLQSLMILRAELERHQTRNKDAPMEESIACGVLSVGKNKAAKNF
jgi:hypothetical protein